MDSLVLALHDLVESYNQEEELCWFGLSAKWEVRQEFQKHCPPSFSDLKPDLQEYKRCKEFKYRNYSAQNLGQQVSMSIKGLSWFEINFRAKSLNFCCQICF